MLVELERDPELGTEIRFILARLKSLHLEPTGWPCDARQGGSAISPGGSTPRSV